MCTALSLTNKDHYFGRTLDLDRSYGEEICILPRRCPLTFHQMGRRENHYALIGMAAVVGQVPLFYDCANEYGLAMAGLNFPGNACYHPIQSDRDNIAPFELLPWILCQCKTIADARKLLAKCNIVNISFSDTLSNTPLHWMIADREGSLVVESTADGLHVYDNPAGVMTNNPPFPLQLFNLNNYRKLQVDNGENTFAANLPLANYCQGLGAMGLPGDVSSMSRFVRIAFGRAHAVCTPEETASVGQFFHLLSSVEMNRGICRTTEGTWDVTVYTSCMNTDRGLYYYTTYENRQIGCVDIHKTNLEGDRVSRYPLCREEQIRAEN